MKVNREEIVSTGADAHFQFIEYLKDFTIMDV